MNVLPEVVVLGVSAASFSMLGACVWGAAFAAGGAEDAPALPESAGFVVSVGPTGVEEALPQATRERTRSGVRARMAGMLHRMAARGEKRAILTM
jgi:hypothetical protein